MLIQQIDPKTAFLTLRDQKNSILIDVRCTSEINFVGCPDLSSINGNYAAVEWQIFPAMTLNPRFETNLVKILQEKFKENAKDAVLIFMCRSGARSSQAAIHMANAGFKHCYNVINGFEGDKDDSAHRGNINGWKVNNLPWRQ